MVGMQRREFLRVSGLAAAAASCEQVWGAALPSPSNVAVPKFPDSHPQWRATWDAALTLLAGNVKIVPKYDKPLLMEGAVYPGAWMECGPLEALVYANLRKYVPQGNGQPDPLAVARAEHMAFFAVQKEDGQIPSSDKLTGETGFGQIQMVVPIAATAWELIQITHDHEMLEATYTACSKWDAWLRRYRDTRKTGLVEGFCTYDTGHDNSPRWKDIPNRCPNNDAKQCPPIATMPRLCPDLSATVYSGRLALAAMAKALGKKDEAARWEQDAETIRKLIIEKLYSPEDAAFYDLDAKGEFVRVRGDLITRVMGEHVLKLEIAGDRKIFNDVWERQLHNPKAFWSPFPFPSIAMDDPAFVRPIPRNSWGGASQALTALRAPRWMEHYGKKAEMRTMMSAWVKAIRDSGEPGGPGEFRQQMDPMTGEFTKADPSGYSPAALVYLDFVQRLAAK
jgi:hypothetical protein